MVQINLKIQIHPATDQHASDWADIFLEALSDCKWMMRYLMKQKITKYDVSQSFIQDYQQQNQDEQFLIAYYNNSPAGIIRLDKYYIPTASKILSHFPLVKPIFQMKGIGKALVKQGIINSYLKGFKDVWFECWSLNRKEIISYEEFYKKLGFESKSARLEMSCNPENYRSKSREIFPQLDISYSNEITDEFIDGISKSYAQSKDILHSIEQLGNFDIAKSFLQQTKEAFESSGFQVQCITAIHNQQLCAALMTATSNYRGMILEVGVLPEFRGMKIGKKIISDYILDMKEKNIQEIILGVDATNIPAIGLYEKLGFKKTWKGNLMLLMDKEPLGLNNELIREV